MDKLRLLDYTPIEPIMAGANFKCCRDAGVDTGWTQCSCLELPSKSIQRASCNSVSRGVEGPLGCRSGPSMCCCAPCGPGLRQFRWLPTADTVVPGSRWTASTCIGLDPPPPAPAGRRERSTGTSVPARPSRDRNTLITGSFGCVIC